MVRRALGPAVAALVLATVLAWLLGGPGAAASAAIGIIVVYANFAANGLSLAWASTVSVVAVQAVAFVGFIVRLAVIVAFMFVLNAFAWFSPVAFGLTVIPATMLLLGFEARLAIRGLGGQLQIPADPAAERAGAALAAREGH